MAIMREPFAEIAMIKADLDGPAVGREVVFVVRHG